ncbi:VWA domain-containing protein [bacterium]|nr:VWA domain-containing protein [bacterium]
MPFTFLNPMMLFAALGAAVPLILHLINMRKTKRVFFSSLHFLEEAQVNRSRSIGLRRLLLLLLRMLAIILLALAAAAPRLPGLSDNTTGKYSLLVLLDSSASMQTVEEGETRFSYACTTAADICRTLPNDSEIQVLTLSSTVNEFFAGWVTAGESSADAILQLTPTDGSANLPAAFKQCRKWVEQAENHPVDILLVSDMQFSLSDSTILKEAVKELDIRTLNAITIKSEPADGAVLSVGLPLRAVVPDQPVTITAMVSPSVKGQKYRLELDGSLKAQAVATVAPGVAQQLAFPITAPKAGSHKGLIASDSDRLRADDSRPFVLEVCKSINLLLIHGQDYGTAGRGGWRYLETALGGDLFNVTALPSDKVAAGDIATADLVALVDPDPLGRQILTELEKVTTRGGSLLLLLGDTNRLSYYQNTLLKTLGQECELVPVARSEQGRENLTVNNYGPVFTDLPEAALEVLEASIWRRYIDVKNSDATFEMEFGSGSPAMLSWSQNSGQIILLPFNLNNAENDIEANAMFPVLMQRIAATLAVGNSSDSIRNAGEIVTFPLAEIAGSASVLLEPIVNDKPLISMPVNLRWQNGIGILDAGIVDQAGFCWFVAGTDTLGVVPVTVPSSESRNPLLSKAEFQKLATDAGFERVSTLSVNETGFISGLSGREMAPWILLLCVITLLFEGYLARRA